MDINIVRHKRRVRAYGVTSEGKAFLSRFFHDTCPSWSEDVFPEILEMMKQYGLSTEEK